MATSLPPLRAALDSMPKLCEEAEQLAVGFRLGLVPRSEIIAWADEMILALDTPQIEIIDLSLMSDAHVQDILHKLGELSSDRPPLKVLPSALQRFNQRLRDHPELGPAVAKGLWDLAVEAKYHVPIELSPIFGFDEDYWLAKNESYGDETDIYAALLDFCETLARVV